MITLYHGDMLVEMDKIPDGSVDAIITDLPFGTTSCAWDNIIPFEKMWKQYNRVIKDNGAIVLFGSQPFTTKLINSNIENFKYELIWDKKHGKAPGVAKYRPMPSHENLLIFGKGTNTYNPQWGEGVPYKDIRTKVSLRNQEDGHKFGYSGVYTSESDGRRYPLSVIEFKTAPSSANVHPTQKPIELLEYLVKTYTNKGDTVLDSTMGSGTTGIACDNTDRRFIGIELDENYFNIAKKRIEKNVKQFELDI